MKKKTRAEKLAKNFIAPEVAALYDAVARYIKSGGGNIVVIGGIEIQEWPDEGPLKWRVAIKCLGRKPVFKTTVTP